MKKLFTILLVVALVLSVGTVSAFATATPRGGNYQDIDNDGICDACGALDADGDGICDNYLDGGICPQGRIGSCGGRSYAGLCGYFVDADGDGIYDNCFNDGICPQDGTGRCGNAGFADADGDGICDNYTNGRTCQQNGTGRRCGRNR